MLVSTTLIRRKSASNQGKNNDQDNALFVSCEVEDPDLPFH
jgi:hypothetical protein